MICPNCKTEFGTQEARRYEQQSAWQIIAANPKHPVWVALICVLPGVLVTVLLCQSFSADEVIKLLTWAGSSGLLVLAANVIKAKAGKT